MKMNIPTIPINAIKSATSIVVVIFYSLVFNVFLNIICIMKQNNSHHASNGTKVNIIPPATTEPICPPTLALIAGISK